MDGFDRVDGILEFALAEEERAADLSPGLAPEARHKPRLEAEYAAARMTGERALSTGPPAASAGRSS